MWYPDILIENAHIAWLHQLRTSADRLTIQFNRTLRIISAPFPLRNGIHAGLVPHLQITSLPGRLLLNSRLLIEKKPKRFMEPPTTTIIYFLKFLSSSRAPFHDTDLWYVILHSKSLPRHIFMLIFIVDSGRKNTNKFPYISI